MSALDMLKKLSQLDYSSSPLKRKQQPTESNEKKSPKKNNSKIEQLVEYFPQKQQKLITNVDLTEMQLEIAEKNKRKIQQARIILKQAEEDDFRENHKMLDEKYDKIYDKKNIEVYIEKWKQNAFKNYQEKMIKQGKGNTTLCMNLILKCSC